MQLPLQAFSLKETSQYLHYLGHQFNHQQVLELYMCIGGIPHYLQHIKGHLSAAQNISELCFTGNSYLLNEFNKLFQSLFENADSYIELIKIIATKRYGITRDVIKQKSKLSSNGGTLSIRLTALEQAGFIKSFIPIDKKERGACYKLTDEYCLFYLTWIEPIRRRLEHETDNSYWLTKINTPKWHNWTGYAFESICLKHVSDIKKVLFIPPGSLSGSWHYLPKPSSHDKGAQIDLLFERPDKLITLCEIKFTSSVFTIDKKYAAELENKIAVFKKHAKITAQLQLALITVNGLKKNNYAQTLISNVATLEDLF